MTSKTRCFLCNAPTDQFKVYDRIINLNPIPICENCQNLMNNVKAYTPDLQTRSVEK